jgi:hypothetical protein
MTPNFSRKILAIIPGLPKELAKIKEEDRSG